MRELKFRAWDKELKMMWIPSLIEFRDGEGALYSHEKSGYIPYYPKQSELMQYTGLKDKNGKEIYEGDIIKQRILRRSGSYGSWWQIKNKNHKKEYYIYRGIKFEIEKTFDLKARFVFHDFQITKKQTEEIEKPIGKERISQIVDSINYTEEDLEVVGNIYENPELLKEDV